MAKVAELQAESRRLMKRKQDEIDAKARQRQEAIADRRRKEEEQAKADREPELLPLDRTVRIQFPSTQLYLLASIDSGSLEPPADPSSTPLAKALASQFGELDHLQFQLPSAGKRVKREMLALATFETLQNAWQAVVTGGEMRCTGLLEECFIGWAQYTRDSNTKEKVYAEPKRVEWYKKHGIVRPSDIGRIRPSAQSRGDAVLEDSRDDPAVPTSTHVYSKAYEARTLQRLRDTARRATLAPAQATH